MRAFVLLATFLTQVSFGIIDPRTILNNLPIYEEYLDLRQRYLNVTKDYPFGWPSYDCPDVESFDRETQPIDVHHLLPSDFGAIAAIGDSLTAGRECLSEDAEDLGNEYMGRSFDSGGDENVRSVGTLPNMLRELTLKLIGPSTGVKRKGEKQPFSLEGFNVAVSGSFSHNLTKQIEELEWRMQHSPAVLFHHDWKFITLFIGSNDLCKYTKDTDEYSAIKFGERMKRALSLIREKFPRTFVNLMPPFNIFALQATHEHSEFCKLFHELTCPSVTALSRQEGQTLFEAYVAQLRDLPVLLNSPTFAVTINPAVTLDELPQLWESPNFAMIAIDCFHWSALTHDAAAKLTWNNLFLNENERRTAHDFSTLRLDRFECPQESCPYLRTSLTNCNAKKSETRAFVQHTSTASGVSPLLALLAVACALALITVASTFVILRVRKIISRPKQRGERSPLLTAHYYEQFDDGDIESIF